MAEFIDARMPTRLAAGFRIGPEQSVTIAKYANGREQRNKNWLYPLYRGEAQIGAFNQSDRASFRDLFMVAGGRHRAFRVTDPTDFTIYNQPCAPSIGTTTPLQLVRTSSYGGEGADRIIQATHAGTVVVKKDGVPVTITADDATGLVTPSANWAAGTYTFDCFFDIWMRFDSDWCSFTAATRDLWTADFGLVEVRR